MPDLTDENLLPTDLLAAARFGELTSEQASDLSERLRGSQPARRLYAEHMLLHAELQWDTVASRIDQSRVAADASDKAAPGERPNLRRWVSVLAAALVLGAAVGINRYFSAGPSSPPPVARMYGTLVNADSVTWSSQPLQAGHDLDAGTIAIDAGRLDLTMTSGATVQVIGPAALQIEGDDRLSLRRGRVHIRAGVSGGFIVDAPGLRVRDLGTEFEVVSVKPGIAVSVMSGRVELTRWNSDGSIAQQTTMTDGQHAALLGQGPLTFDDAAHDRLMRASPIYDAQPVAAYHLDSPDSDGATQWIGGVERTAGLEGDGAARFGTKLGAVTLQRPLAGFNFERGFSMEVDVKLEPAAAWPQVGNRTVLRYEPYPGAIDAQHRERSVQRLLLAFQGPRFIRGDYGLLVGDAGTPGLTFGFVAEQYTELDIALDGKNGRPHMMDLVDGKAHHLAVTYDTDSGRVAAYIDGRRVADGQLKPGVAPQIPTEALTMNIGAYGRSPALVEPFMGIIDELRFFDRAIEADQVQRDARRLAEPQE
ncbi:MAG: hypothetical protein GC162_16175 [Planctomycetes bacterium]|nr:hypothetical protein [Planctomycetota bacterium]